MKSVMNVMVCILFILTWVTGAVIATPGINKLLAIYFFPYAWYILIERIITVYFPTLLS